jgi:hypothetical protein
MVSLSSVTFRTLSEATKSRFYKAFNKIPYRAHKDGINVQSYAEREKKHPTASTRLAGHVPAGSGFIIWKPRFGHAAWPYPPNAS